MFILVTFLLSSSLAPFAGYFGLCPAVFAFAVLRFPLPCCFRLPHRDADLRFSPFASCPGRGISAVNGNGRARRTFPQSPPQPARNRRASAPQRARRCGHFGADKVRERGAAGVASFASGQGGSAPSKGRRWCRIPRRRRAYIAAAASISHAFPAWSQNVKFDG